MTDQLPKLRRIDPGKLKLRELAEIERMVGRRIAGELQSGDLGIDTMQALVCLELRRHDPAASFEQAGEYELDMLLEAFADEEFAAEPDPPSAGPAPSSGTPPGGPSSNSLQPSATSGG